MTHAPRAMGIAMPAVMLPIGAFMIAYRLDTNMWANEKNGWPRHARAGRDELVWPLEPLSP